MADFIGLAMSKITKNIKKVTSLKDLDFDSDLALLKIAMADDGIVNADVTDGSGTASVEITHNLGYIPRVMVSVSLEGGFILNDIDAYVSAPYSAGASAGYWGDWISYEVTTTKLIINASGNGWQSDARMGYKYNIFYDEA